MQSQERMTQRQKLDFGFHPSKKHRLKAGRMRADKEGGVINSHSQLTPAGLVRLVETPAGARSLHKMTARIAHKVEGHLFCLELSSDQPESPKMEAVHMHHKQPKSHTKLQ
jgi:hypothetical protein